ncbi:prorelaxin H1 [Kryptolebias marmoratus]|uniref:Relaxin-3 n=1 Tax=Kryptolebias marmoratus TaxID=37003 RepID=A0A3Q3AE35_KRYMA|nr:prorelaxin H1 [Kryptolebias marmoratus]XP_037835467.1 prorelaxin H1 [Kryptolebias marmoratus]
MLWRVALAVVCVGGACGGATADVVSRMIVPRDYGVKLCGREFIRAVIFTCGGSRWRRSTEGDLDPFQWTSFGDLTAEDNQQTWQRDSEPRDIRAPLPVTSSSSLSDLLTLYRATSDRQQPPPPVGSALLGEQEAAANWSVSSRKKRNFSLGVAGMCCSQGCTKNDIGRLC